MINTVKYNFLILYLSLKNVDTETSVFGTPIRNPGINSFTFEFSPHIAHTVHIFDLTYGIHLCIFVSLVRGDY